MQLRSRIFFVILTVEAKYLSYDFKEECHTVGSARLLQRAMELYNENTLVIPGSVPLGAFKPSNNMKPVEELVEEVNRKLSYLRVQNDAALIIPSLEKLAEIFGTTVESLKLHGVHTTLQEAREMRAKLQPLMEFKPDPKTPGDRVAWLVDSSTLKDSYTIVGSCELENKLECLGLTKGKEHRLGLRHVDGATDMIVVSGTILGCCGHMKVSVADDFEEVAGKPFFDYCLGSGQRFVSQEDMQITTVPEYLTGKGFNFSTADKKDFVYGQKATLNVNGDLQCYPTTKCFVVAEHVFGAIVDDTTSDRIGLFAGPLGKDSLAKLLPVMCYTDTPSKTAYSQYYLSPGSGVKLCVVAAQDIEIPAGKTLIL